MGAWIVVSAKLLAVEWETFNTTFAVSNIVSLEVFAFIYMDSDLIYPNLHTVPSIVVAVSRSLTSSWSPTVVRVKSLGRIP